MGIVFLLCCDFQAGWLCPSPWDTQRRPWECTNHSDESQPILEELPPITQPSICRVLANSRSPNLAGFSSSKDLRFASLKAVCLILSLKAVQLILSLKAVHLESEVIPWQLFMKSIIPGGIISHSRRCEEEKRGTGCSKWVSYTRVHTCISSDI